MKPEWYTSQKVIKCEYPVCNRTVGEIKQTQGQLYLSSRFAVAVVDAFWEQNETKTRVGENSHVKLKQKVQNIKNGVKKKNRVKRLRASVLNNKARSSPQQPSRFCSIVIYLRDETDKPEAKRFITVRNAIWLITINTNRFHTEAVHAASLTVDHALITGLIYSCFTHILFIYPSSSTYTHYCTLHW